MHSDIGIIFDLDGTLLDTLGDLTDAVNYTLRQFGYPEHSEAYIRSVVGSGARNLIKGSLPQNTEDSMVDSVLQVYREYYQTHSQIKTKPYAGICDVLNQLQTKYNLAIVSNKPDSDVKILSQTFFPGVYALGERPNTPRKPAPDMIRNTMEHLGVSKAVYVGDSEVDILTANNAGLPCISVLWGFRDRELLEKCGGSCFCSRAEQLIDAVESLV